MSEVRVIVQGADDVAGVVDAQALRVTSADVQRIVVDRCPRAALVDKGVNNVRGIGEPASNLPEIVDPIGYRPCAIWVIESLE